jgi:hypothetical protein
MVQETLEEKTDTTSEPMVRCGARRQHLFQNNPEYRICGKMVPKSQIQYVGETPYCPDCYQAWGED